MGKPSPVVACLPPQTVRIAERLESSSRPILCSHERLDGDGVGAELGLYHILSAMGKEPLAVNDGPVPKLFHFLPRVEEVRQCPEQGALRGGPLVVLDTPTRKRVGKVLERVEASVEILSIDHHRPVEQVGSAEWIDTSKSSVGEMVCDLAAGRGWPITPEAATCLYVAIVTDTGRFSFPNTRPSTLRWAAALVEAGADHKLASERLYQWQSLGVVRVQGEAAAGITLECRGRVGVMCVSEAMFRRHNVDPIDTQEFADMPRSIEGVEVGVTLREMMVEGKVKVSLRSRGGVNVAEVARLFGGGGHAEAAGCEVKGGMAEVREKVLASIREHLP